MEPIYIVADTQRAVSRDAIYVTQNDSVQIIVKIQQNGKDEPLASDHTYTLTSLREDGVSILSPVGVPTGANEISFNLGTQAVAIIGKTQSAVQILQPDGRVSTLAFVLNVVRDVSSNFIPSENEQTLIELVLGEGPAILTAAEQATVNAHDSASNADQKATLAQTAADNADEKAQLADSAATNANAKAQLADEKATLADEKATLADNASVEANTVTDAMNAALPNVQGLVNRESYNASTPYKKNNIVEHNGSSWQALQDTTGNPPPTLPMKSNSFWTLLAQRGIDGTGAVSSVNGVGPDINGDVVLDIATSWDDLTAKPTSFPPSEHTHTIGNVNGLQTALDSKAKKAQDAWISGALASGWSASGTIGIRYRKNDLGKVEVELWATSGTITGLTQVSSMPVGYRPSVNSVMTIVKSSNGDFGGKGLYFNRDGRILVPNGIALETNTIYEGIITYFGI